MQAVNISFPNLNFGKIPHKKFVIISDKTVTIGEEYGMIDR